MAAGFEDLETSLSSLASSLASDAQTKHEWLKRLVNTSPVVTYACHPGGDYGATFVSDGIKSLWGYEPEEFLHDSGFWAARIHPEDAAQVFEGLAGLRTKSHHVHEYRFRVKSGEYRWVYDELRLLKDETGTPVEIVGHCFDITERKRAEAARSDTESKLELIFNSTQDLQALFRVEPEDQFVTEVLNQALIERFHASTGGDARVYIGRNFEALVAATGVGPQEIEQRRALYMTAVREKKPVRFSTAQSPKRDAAEISIYPVLDQSGTCTHILWSAHTITERLKAEADLRASEERYALVLQATLDGIFDWDLVNHRYYLSPQYKAILGYQDHELPSDPSSFFDRVHPEDQPELTKNVVLFSADPERQRFSNYLRLLHRDGKYRWVVSRGRIVRGSQSEPTRIIGAVRDITDRFEAEEKLQASEQFQRQILDSLFGGVVIYQLDGAVVSANRAPLEATGMTLEQVVGKKAWELDWCSSDPAERARLRDRIAHAARGEVVRFETETRSLDGRIAVVDVTYGPLRDRSGTITNVIGFGVDITARKEAEAQLEEARRMAESASRTKSEFLANMSHELRTPMNAIIGLTELMLDSNLTSEQREYMGIVKNSAESLLAVLSDILDISVLQAGRYVSRVKEFHLRDVLSSVIQESASGAIAKSLRLSGAVSPEVPEVVEGDPEGLRHILTNLLRNAVKFTTAGVIEVRVERESESGMIHCSVRDTGIGVPSEKHQIIFEAFSQADGSSRRQFGGTGLGLAICAQLASVMSGRVWVESDGATGSTFHFEAPMKTIR